jgi:hypothetical protein
VFSTHISCKFKCSNCYCYHPSCFTASFLCQKNNELYSCYWMILFNISGSRYCWQEGACVRYRQLWRSVCTQVLISYIVYGLFVCLAVVFVMYWVTTTVLFVYRYSFFTLLFSVLLQPRWRSSTRRWTTRPDAFPFSPTSK